MVYQSVQGRDLLERVNYNTSLFIIGPIAIAYIMGQITKSVCVCVSVRVGRNGDFSPQETINHSQCCFRNDLGVSERALRAPMSINSNDGRGRPCSRVALRQTFSRHCSQNAPVSINSNVGQGQTSSRITYRQAVADCFHEKSYDNTGVYLRTTSHHSRSVRVFQLDRTPRTECNQCFRNMIYNSGNGMFTCKQTTLT